MKYDEEIDPEDTTTSHGLVVRLVGSRKRVLDVGCANGQLAEFLERQGNEVSGVELDPALAEIAKSRLRTVVVGDVEQLDLVAEFGRASVDVVIFADVLEHLKNPLAALRQARELLAEGGCVVASIPNIAHGAARLGLLQGRFEYRDLGLLDDTHLRFFTRSSVEHLLRSAGFIVTEWQQTTADPFGTEIRLRPDDFPADVVEQIEQDPDSRTYQFVVRAIPFGTPSGDEAVTAELTAAGREVERLRGEVAAIARGLSSVPRRPVIGLLEAAHPAELRTLARLRTAVVLAELRRRLLGFEVRAYGLHPEPIETGVVGEMVRPLLPWDQARRVQVASEVEAMVVVAGTVAHPDLAAIVDDLGQVGCTVTTIRPDPPAWVGAEKPPDSIGSSRATARPVPDPLALIGRSMRHDLLQQRAAYLRLCGLLPRTTGFILGYLAGRAGDASDHMVETWQSMARRADADLVVIDPMEARHATGGMGIASDDLTTVDFLATIEVAGLVVTDSPALLAAACGLARPGLGVATGVAHDGGVVVAPGPLEPLVGRPDELVALGPVAAADPDLEQSRDEVGAALDLWLDDLAGQLLTAGVRQLRMGAAARLAELTEQVRTLETVNAGLRNRLAREQSVVAEYARRVAHADLPEGATDLYVSGSERALRELRVGQTEIDRLQREIAAIYATRTMRTLQPARRLYGKLRSRRK